MCASEPWFVNRTNERSSGIGSGVVSRTIFVPPSSTRLLAMDGEGEWSEWGDDANLVICGELQEVIS